MRWAVLVTMLAASLIMTSPAQASDFSYHGECIATDDGDVAIKARISGYSYRYYGPMRWVWRAQDVGTPDWRRMKTGFRQTLRVDIDQSWEAHFHSDPRPALNRVYRVTALLGKPVIFRIGVAYCAG